ncbi:hypothetical protein quinque_009162 [Culex quinquefasciatus]|uniref:uncharacterized protein LOC6049442 n=1 Tax=Culex quinquefasciatus TaxID=7176 RepID=UPI0018E2E456|nr:uncharacterized protein LOC6049442 [Culex quinquefasciatus]XP_039445516.1 uncharacterized protein LOC120425153 [Culex pipiens pallens]
MKQQTVFVLLALLLVSASCADALVYVYAKTCSTCRSLGARNCGYGSLGSKKYVSCDGATAIRNCDDCRRRFGTCQDRYITECFIG